MALTGLHATDYKSTLKNLIASKEGYKTKVYTDGVGVPTIGAGYALTSHSGTWTTDFATAGITPTATQQTALQKLIDASQKVFNSTKDPKERESQVKALVTTYNASSNAITINVTQIGNLFETIKSTYENIVKSNLGTTLYNSLANTKELVTLVDLAYNGGEGIFGSSLVNALKNNDRAEAWFQIRYQSNGGSSYQTVGTGMAERRIAESNLFDLYPTDADENYYKQVMQMYEKNKKIIYAVEHNTFKPSGNDEPIKRAYEKDGLIDTQLSPAKDYLVSHYAQGITIDGDIIVGQGIGKEGEAYADTTTDINDANLQGTEKNDLIFGEKGKDTLIGGAGKDVLYGGEEDDVLVGNIYGPAINDESDYLDGGEGKDTYVTAKDDKIHDSDGRGLIYFNNVDLTGTKTKVKDTENKYEDKEGFTYEETGGKLLITKGSESITIDNWGEVVKTTDKTKEALGIVLSEGGDIVVNTESNSALEVLEQMPIPVKLDRVVEPGEELIVQIGYYYNITKREPVGDPYWVAPVPKSTSRYYDGYTGTWHTSSSGHDGYWYQPTKTIVIGQGFNSYGEMTFGEGEQEKDFIYRWTDNSVNWVSAYPNPAPMIPKIDETNSTYGESIQVTIDKSGTGTIIDDDPATSYDPLILDTNKDGFITTTSLSESTTYFDITGDGLRERVGWVSGEDALLVYDKNEDGKVSGIDEVFGNLTQSGFEELKTLIDSNHDNIIDRKDELFNQLQVWNDLNGDAKVQEGELRSLSEAGIKNINLNLVETNIDINGNTITEASKYTTDEDTHELVVDVQLATDTKDTKVEPDDIPDFEVDEQTLALPQLKGSGQVYDSFIAYNVDPEFKAIALAYANDLSKLQKNPDALIENYSGYTKLISQLRVRYSAPEFSMSEADKKAWIADRFFGTDTFMSDIEKHYTTNLNNANTSIKSLTNDTNAISKYDVLRDRMESSFVILSHYKELFSDTHYDSDNGKFVIDDEVAFNAKIIQYFNTNTHSTEEKLYLASVLEMQHSGLIFNRSGIAKSITDAITQELVKDIFAGKEVTFIDQGDTAIKDIVLGSEEADILNIGNTNAKVLLGTGDDKFIASKGNNEYFYRRGDGHDILQDGGGLDTLNFEEGITRDDVIVKLVRNSDLVIALKEEGKSFDELENTITIVDFMKSSNRFEIIRFGDGKTLRFKEVLEQYQPSDANELLTLSNDNDTIDTGNGDDVIQGLAGNDKLIGGKGDDRLEGGIGNDIYVYSKGDGKDTIIDTAGYDTLQFTAELTADDLVAQYQGNDLLIGVKEKGKNLDDLSDVITLENYKNSSSTIEAIYFDGYQRVDIDKFLNASTEEADTLVLGNGDDTIDLLGGNDTVSAGGGNDTLYGGSGNDTLNGEDGNDVLVGGAGDDSLKGGKGNDTYIFNRGDGKDTIYDDLSFGFRDSQKENAGRDTLQFGEGIGAEDVLYRYDGANLIIALKEDGKSFEELSDVITIKNYTNADNKIENILLSDGSSVTIESTKNGTGGNDTLDYKDSTEDVNLQGLSGFNFIHGGSGNDNILGGGDPDTLYAGDGDDTLIGASGDDFLAGGSGNDRYIFRRGDGSDVILDDNRPEYINFGTQTIKINNLLAKMDAGGTAKEDAGVDTLEFGEGISKEDISHRVSGNDLIINIAGSGGGSIYIVNHLLSENKIENILLADGTSVDLFATTDGDDNLIFGNEDTTIDALGGDDIVATGTGNDTITGGKGADTLKGGNGDDTYIFKRGDGKDRIEDTLGVDTLSFADGISQDDVIVRLIGRDLVVALKEEGKSFEELSDVVTIKNHTNTDNKLENISFTNGTTLDVSTIALGTQGNDNFIFGSASTTIDALAGDDTVATSHGNDTITGGKGADTLKGGNGDDTYIFKRGDGKDSIEDTLGVDTLNFGDGIGQDDVIVRLIGRDLVVALKEDGKTFEELSDMVTIKNHTNTANKLENISFTDGSTVDVSTITFGTEENDNFIFGSLSTTIDALDGDDIVATGNGNDTITGGTGDDILKSGDGEDTLSGGSGNDTLMGGRENDTYIFGRGDGHDTIHDYINGIDAWGGTLSFDKNESTGKVIVNLTGGNVETTLRSMEREFYRVATNFNQTDGLKAEDIFIKLVGDELIIAKYQDGKFENWPNKIIFKQTVSDNGVYSYEEVETKGNLDIEYLQDSLAFTTQTKNKEGETTTSMLTFTQDLNAGNDTLKFTEDISQEDITFKFIGNDLILGLKEEGKTFEELSDTLTLKDYVKDNNKIEHIFFSDGSAFTFDTTPMPTESDDNFAFGNSSISIDLLGGDDIAVSGSGNDSIVGGSGNDNISSGAGSDTLEGGVGNDTIDGGLGNDTYVFNRGDGKDTISDDGGLDTLKFGSDVAQSDLLFKQEGSDLWVALKDANTAWDALGDKILLKDWFTVKRNIESISLVDGTSLSATQIATMVLDNQPDTLYSNHGAIMTGGFGDDTYVYKKDDFTVIVNDQFKNNEIAVNAGTDTLKFEDINKTQVTIGIKGNDLIIKIDAGHDTYTELKDYVVIRDWRDANRGIESIVFGDGEVLSIDKTAIYPALEFDENWITSRYYIYGSEDNVINGTDASEVIESGAGDDTINAKDGSDFITGGLGNDTIDGGKGNDTFVFNLGEGHDVITDIGGVDTIKFGSGISRSDITITRVDSDLVMSLGVDDSVTLKDWFNEETIEHRVELMVLENEGTIAIADFITAPTEGNDDLEYGDENNRIDALGGDDIMHIGGGDDVLYGNDGDDQLYGEEGNDVISGDKGTDTLYGGEGDDTYLFGRGDGKDTIIEDDFTDWGRTGKDTLKFKEGITPDDLMIIQSGDDLVVALQEDGKNFEELSDKITLKKWALYDDTNSRDYGREYFTVELFAFNDGTSWSMSDIIAHIGSDAPETIIGFNQADTLEGKKGDDTLLGHLGDDTYVFNRGDGKDTIYDYGRKGDDYSYYDAGNDTLRLGEGIGSDDFFVQKFEDSDDIIIYLLEEGKTFEELSDKVTIKDWFKTNNRIENLILSDGTQIDLVAYLNAGPTERNDKLVYGNSDDVVNALAGDDIIIADGGNDYVDGNNGNDQLEGGEGTDTLFGNIGDDTLVGGKDDDRLEGGEGSDTYLFTLGDGHDIISDYSTIDGEIDTITFGNDIDASNVQFTRNSANDKDLIITIDADNSITVENWFLEGKYKLEELVFADGTILNSDDVENRVIFYGDEHDNVMVGTDNSELAIYGYEGNDTITGNGGADTFNGGKDDDRLEGGKGSDTYFFNLGDGHDVISDYSAIDEEVDTITFGNDIDASNVQFTRNSANDKDLIITIDENNSITIENWFLEGEYKLEKLLFTDGTVLSIDDVESKVVYYGDVNDNIMEGTDNSELAIYGCDGNDTITGNAGDESIDGGNGNDTYIFNKGSGRDTMVDSSGVDTIKFAPGITINDLFIKKDGETLLVALYEDGKDFETFSDVISLSINDIEKIAFDDGSGIDIKDIMFEKAVTDDILEKDGIATVYTGSLNEDSSTTPHAFTILSDTIQVDSFLDTMQGKIKSLVAVVASPRISDVSITVINAQTGEYELSGNFDALQEGEKVTVTFDYEVNYDSDDITLVSGPKKATLVVTGTNDLPEVSGDFLADVIKNTTTGILSISDADHDQNELQEQQNTVGTYGTFSISADREWHYNITSSINPEDVGKTETFQVTSKDGSVTKDIVLTISDPGANHAPVVTPIMQETLVNTYTRGDQGNPQICALSNGGYIISWVSGNYYYGNENEGDGIYLQAFNAKGERVGDEQILPYSVYPQIIALQEGEYVATWESYGQDGSENGVYLQRFDANGRKVGEEQQQVNTYTDSSQSSPQITALKDGGYVVTWESYGQDGSENGVYLQRFDDNGRKAGEEQQANTYTDGSQSNPQITALQDGGYVVTWQSSEQDGSSYGVYLQRFDANGEKVGGEQQVNTYTNDYQDSPQITALQDGGYVVTWESHWQNYEYGVYLQQYNSSGEKVGNEQQVSTYTTYLQFSQKTPQITALNDGGYVVTWESYSDPDSQYGWSSGVYLQRFDANGEKVGVNQQVNTYNASHSAPQITALNDGGYVVTWESYKIDGSGMGIYLQRFDANGKKVGNEPQTNFFYTGQSLSGNLDYIVDPDGDTLSYSAVVPENITFSIDKKTGHWDYYYGGSGEVVVTVDDGEGGILDQTLTFINNWATPLVLDLNHDGITSTSLSTSPTYFDYDGNGIKEHTAWMEQGDAQLVADLNHDGQISNGSEIFGEYTKLPDGSLAKNGYEALAQYDTNGDRVIDSKDEAFGNLSLWFDKNQNGKSEEGELVNIQLSSVTAINLDRKDGITFTQRSENGNIILNETSYKGIDSDGIIRDVGFAYDATDTITNNDTLDSKYYGQLLSGEDGNDIYLYNLGDGKITINDNGDGQDRVLFGEGIVPEQILVKWDKVTGDLIIGIRQSIYDPSSITEVSDQIHLQNWFEESGSIESFKFANGQSLTKESLYDLLLSTKEERALTARVLEENGSLEGGTYSDLLYGTTGEEALYGNEGNDYLKGLEGDDLLQGGGGNDILVGGEGDDSIEGGSGDDLYIYNRGDGRDLITDFLGKDTIAFGEGILKNEIVWEIAGTNLVLGLKEEGKSFTELTNTITIENWEQPGFGIEYVEFYDGSRLTLKEFFNQSPILTAAEVSVALKDIRESTGSMNASDPDNDTLVYSITTQAAHGSLSVNEKGEWIYKANAGYMGADSAIIKVDDGNGGVVEQTLNFTLEVSAPTINTTALNLLEDNSYSNALSVTNPIGGALTYSIVDATDHGNFVLNSDGTYSYNPSSNYNGVDSVTLKVTNEYGLSTTQTIALDITPVNDIPTFASSDDESYLLKNTRIVTGAINASDVDGDTLTYALTSNPTHGTLTLNSTTGVWSYESLFGYTGSDHATMSVSDGKGGVISKNMIFNAKGLVYEGGNIIIPAQTIGDKLDLGSIGMDALSFTKNGNNLAISVKDQGVITISDYFTQPNQALKTLSTSWGEINIGKEAIKQASGAWWGPFGSATANNGVDSLLIGSNYSDRLTGASGNDILFGSSNNDRLIGNAGNDLLLGGSGNDTLMGSSGKDTLYGDSGNDTLDAKEGDDNLLGGIGSDSLYAGSGADKLSSGSGSDYLQGGIGNDTYYFNVGDGKDVIEDTTFSFCSWNTPEGGDDTIVFGKGIEKEDVTFLMQCGNLSIKYGDKESVVISGQNSDASAIERFELSDGSYLSSNDVESIIHQMSAYAKDHGIYISSNSSIENNQALMQIVSSGWHNA